MVARTWESHKWAGNSHWSHRLNQAQLNAFVGQLNGSASSIREMSRRVLRLEMEIARVQSMSCLYAKKTADSVDKLRDIKRSFDSNLSKCVFGLEEWNRESPEKIDGVLSLIEELDVRRRLDDMGRLLMTILIPVIILIGEIAVSNAYVAILVSRQVDADLQRFIKIQAICITSLLLIVFVFLGWLFWRRNSFFHRSVSTSEPVESNVDADAKENVDGIKAPNLFQRRAKRSQSDCARVTDSTALEELRHVWARSRVDQHKSDFTVPWIGRFARTQHETNESDASRSMSGSRSTGVTLKSCQTIDVPNPDRHHPVSPLRRCHSFTPLTSGCKSLLDDDDDKTPLADAAAVSPGNTPASMFSKMKRYVPSFSFWNTTPTSTPQTNVWAGDDAPSSSSGISHTDTPANDASSELTVPRRSKSSRTETRGDLDSEDLVAQRRSSLESFSGDLGLPRRETPSSQRSSFEGDVGYLQTQPSPNVGDSQTASSSHYCAQRL